MGWFKKDVTHQSTRTAVTIIARGNKLSGEMSLLGKLHIDGIFEGQITSVDSVTIGRRGEVRGVIRAHQVSVCGQVDGEIYCDELSVERGGSVRGAVHSRHMSIHKRGNFIGERCLTADKSPLAHAALTHAGLDQAAVGLDSLTSAESSQPATTAVVSSPQALSLSADLAANDMRKPEQLTRMLGELPKVGKSL